MRFWRFALAAGGMATISGLIHCGPDEASAPAEPPQQSSTSSGAGGGNSCLCEATCLAGNVTVASLDLTCGGGFSYTCLGGCLLGSLGEVPCEAPTPMDDPLGICGPPPCRDLVGAGDVVEGVAYGPAPRQIMDIYLPDVPGDELLPLFAWIHGGGWEAGTLENIPPQAVELRARGFVVVSIEYRLSDTPFPTTISDTRQAIRWLQEEGSTYRIDPSRVVVAGSSAGGHLATMLGVASDVPQLDLVPGLSPPEVALVVDFFGHSDLLELDADAAECVDPICHDCEGSSETKLIDCPGTLASCAEGADLVSPVTHVDADDPPFIILHGTSDCVVPPSQSQRLHDALAAAEVESALIMVEGANHSDPEVGTDEVWGTIGLALDERILGCVR